MLSRIKLPAKLSHYTLKLLVSNNTFLRMRLTYVYTRPYQLNTSAIVRSIHRLGISFKYFQCAFSFIFV